MIAWCLSLFWSWFGWWQSHFCWDLTQMLCYYCLLPASPLHPISTSILDQRALHLIRPELRCEIRPVRVKLLKDAPLRLLSITRTCVEWKFASRVRSYWKIQKVLTRTPFFRVKEVFSIGNLTRTSVNHFSSRRSSRQSSRQRWYGHQLRSLGPISFYKRVYCYFT